MAEKIRRLKGANVDIDLMPNEKITWKMDKCAVKNLSLCKFFRGIKNKILSFALIKKQKIKFFITLSIKLNCSKIR